MARATGGRRRNPGWRALSPTRIYRDFEDLAGRFGQVFDLRFWDRFFGQGYVRLLLIAFIVYLIATRYFATVLASSVDDGAVVQESTSRLNQLFFSVLFLLSLPVLYNRRRFVWKLFKSNPWIILAVLWCWLSITWAGEPALAFRRVIRMTMGMTIILAVCAGMPSKRAVLNTLLLAVTVILVLDLAVYPLGGIYFQREDGLFRGVHGHKNLASAFAVVATILWIFVLFGARRWLDLLAIIPLSMALFVLFAAGGKAAIAVLPGVIAVAALLEMSLRRGQPALFYAMMALGLGATLLMLIVVVVGPGTLATMIWGDPTLTGRTRIWSAVLPLIQSSPLLGYGFQVVFGVEGNTPLERVSDEQVVGFGHAHNGYIDITLELGLIGLVLVLLSIAVPFVQLFRIARAGRLARNVGPFIGILVALIVLNGTEASFFESTWLWYLACLSIWYIAAYRVRLGTVPGRPSRRPVRRLGSGGDRATYPSRRAAPVGQRGRRPALPAE